VAAPETNKMSERPSKGAFRGLLARDGGALLAAGGATLAVEFAAWLLGRQAGGHYGTVGSLAVMTIWVVLAAPALSAGSRDLLGGLLRGGIVVDASAVLLVFLSATSPFMTFAGACKTYCILAAAGLFGVAVVRFFRSAVSRLAAAVVVSFLLMAALATPFWTGRLLELRGEAGHAAACAAVWLNPFFSVLSSLPEGTPFVWQQQLLMYDITRIGDYQAAPATPWYMAVAVYGGLALLAAVARAARARIERRD
jgi:hypothetical protein